MTANPVRRWMVHTLGHSPLTRGVDRVEAWAVLALFVMLIAAAYPALAIGHKGYDARTQQMAAAAVSSHPVQATALGSSMVDPSVSESTPTTFMVNVRWSAQGSVREAVSKVDGPVKAGDKVQIWVTDQGKITTAPPTHVDALWLKNGTVALAWLVLAALVVSAYGLLRTRLNRARDRQWDRGWRSFVENGGGSATFTP